MKQAKGILRLEIDIEGLTKKEVLRRLREVVADIRKGEIDSAVIGDEKGASSWGIQTVNRKKLHDSW